MQAWAGIAGLQTVAMESQRLILFFIFSFSLFMLIDAWHRDQNPPQVKPAESTPQAEKKDATVPPVPTEKAAVPAQGNTVPPPAITAPTGAAVTVDTDDFRAVFTMGLRFSTAGVSFSKH